MANIQVTPTQTQAAIQAAINGSSAGDTITFSAGTYTLAPGGTNGALQFPASRSYIGTGATLGLTTGVDTTGNQNLVNVAGSTTATPTSVTGFTFTDAQVFVANGSFNLHANTFKNIYRGLYVLGASGSFTGNSFTNTSAEGIYGYPASNLSVTGNTFNSTFEAIHFIAAVDSMNISNNTVLGTRRFAFEIQEAATNLTISDNYIGEFVAFAANANIHCGMSVATGYGVGINITNNTILQTSGDSGNYTGSGPAIEIMGSKVSVENNIAWGWSTFFLNGAQSPNASSGNKIYGGSFSSPDVVPYTLSPFTSTGDQLLPLSGLSPIPAPPGSPAPPAPPAPPVPPVVIPAGITSVLGTPGTINITAPVGSVIALVQQNGVVVQIPAPNAMTGTTATIKGIPGEWSLAVQVTTGGKTYTLPFVAQPAATPYTTFAPSLSQPAPVNPPPPVTPPVATVVHVVETLSNGKISIDGASPQ
jgi:Right handed beta helix region